MEKDFTFYESIPASHNRLTANQIETYNRNGYLNGIPLFDEDQADANRTYFDGLLAFALSKGKNSYSISGSHVTYGGVYDHISQLPTPTYSTWPKTFSDPISQR